MVSNESTVRTGETMYSRLTTHRHICIPGEISIDGTNLLRNVREGFTEKFEALFFHCLKVILCPLGSLPRIFEVLVCRLESVLYPFEPLNGSHVWRHMIQFAVQGGYFLL